ncbi:hypothetical protein EDWATA_02549 [Edwardsiella tarda ATCC 23685]|uniref:Uncharacterized protein n=1 Tax=Edwardsiella tarda ATCC 23685 TaxID=500638 RepID=D4F715_EDWTA|nr:hypothetical protein EDWATA_02549 [Edwardsiella tarda ATCC 23685]
MRVRHRPLFFPTAALRMSWPASGTHTVPIEMGMLLLHHE